MKNSFTDAHPTFFAYAVIGGHNIQKVDFVYGRLESTQDDSFTFRMFPSKVEAEMYAQDLLEGKDPWANTDGDKCDYSRIHTVGNDGRISPNSYFFSV